MIFPAILGSVKMNTSQKNKFFHQAFYQWCLQKTSTNPQITLDLHTLTEETLDRKLQNLQNFLQWNVFSVWPCTLHTAFLVSDNFICASSLLATQGYSDLNDSELIFD